MWWGDDASEGALKGVERDGRVEDSARFGPGTKLSYALERSGGGAVSARLEGVGVVVSIPAEMAATWCRSDQVGIEAEHPCGEGESLKILVEKDFTCLKTRSGEDESDAFPNPHDHC